MPIGTLEVIIVLAVVLVIFGPKKLPQLARAIGNSVREYRRGLSGEQGSKEKPKG